MKIAFIMISSFPKGMASSTRIASITRGLVQLGVDASVVIPESPQPHTSDDSMPDCGEWNGVKYFNLQGRKRNRFAALRFLAMKSGWRFWSGVTLTRKWLKRHPVDVVFLYMDEPRYLEAYTKISKEVEAKVLFNFDEYPVPIREQGASKLPDWKRFYYEKVLQNVDGYVSINQTLKEFYNAIAERPTLVMSMVVDINRFDGRLRLREDWLVYMGQILPDKDNIANIIQAFKLIENRYPCLSFHIYGKAPKHVIDNLKVLVESLGLNNRIIFEGMALNEEVPNIMARAKILVSSQPNNDRVKGVLSTKLAEYVAMGTPTIMCDVGENRTYLSDKDCFFTVPDNSREYAEVICRILDDYDNALTIARHGRDTIRSKFTNMIAASALVQFCNRLFN